eukprot:GEMP01009069.1.p1 GENE.GEMP01009069.1~~GEMP01009069.1.p1  ORF type:complete len:786 (+),score=112.06 GEMP01009069.1:54-2411(+)
MLPGTPGRMSSFTPQMAHVGSSSGRDLSMLLLGDVAGVQQKFGRGKLHGAIYGAVGLVVLIPTMVSYAHIIFNSPTEFEHFMPMIIKMLFLSSALHQLVFSMRSEMAFAVGQIQDVGLIFLSAIVRDILKSGRAKGLQPEEIVATSLWVCGVATTIVGLLVFCVGKAKLTDYVQLIPLPVVGGYLGYIGYFSLAAGLSITTGEYISGPETFVLLLNRDFLWKLVVMFMLVIVFFICLERGGTFTMPIALTAIPIVFFVVTFASGYSVADAQDARWLARESPIANGLEAVKLYDPALVDWSLFPRQVPNLLCLAVVVIFGSSLDIAAVQADYAERLDFNKEMETVGLGNMLSGMFGGFTGSYIFSQTVFNLKLEVGSRWQGIVIVLGELAVFIVGYDTQQVLPLVYIGAIMSFFGFGIMYDWLIQSRALVSHVEYCLLWFSFLFILIMSGVNSFGILAGMVLASLLAVIVFAFHYARVRTWREVHTHASSVVRNFEQTRTLNKLREQKIFCVRIRGYVFFGSALDLLNLQRIITASTARFIIIDFARCDGVDSSAASAFASIKTAANARNKELLITGAKGEVEKLLRSHGVVHGETRPFFLSEDLPNMDEALKTCEDRILGRIHCDRCNLHEHLLSFVQGYPCYLDAEHLKANAVSLAMHFEMKAIPKGHFLFRQSDPADAMYLLLKGTIVTDHPSNVMRSHTGLEHSSLHKATAGTLLGDLAFFATSNVYMYDAYAATASEVGIITRETVERLEKESPDLIILLQRILLRNMSIFAVQSMESTFL